MTGVKAVGTDAPSTSGVLPALAARQVEALELEADAGRVRRTLKIGLGLWITAGVLNDTVVFVNLPTVTSSFVGLVIMRVLSTLLLIIFLVGLRGSPSRRRLDLIESSIFVVAALGEAGFQAENRGLPGPGVIYMAMILLAQGVMRPRAWRHGLVILTVSFVTYLIGIAFACLTMPKMASQWADPTVRTTFLHGCVFCLSMIGLLVYGGHGAYRVRREAFAARQVGRYQLKHRLGRGGGGDVWQAWHPGLRRDVALKILRSREIHAAEQFEQEIDAIARLSHPSLVRLLDRGVTDDGLRYFAMELVRGETLAELVRQAGSVPPARAAHLVAQAAGALAEAHRGGVVHRDLKPENVMVTRLGDESDAIKVLDFGQATVRVERTQSGNGPPSAHGPGGTPRFMAPEVLAAAAPDARADVFALGALFVFLIAGRSPLEDEHGQVSVLALDRLPAQVDALPPKTQALVRRALARDPAARQADAGEFARELAAAELAGQWLPKGTNAGR